MPTCLARYSKLWLKFGDGTHRFLAEDVCGKLCEESASRCPDCCKPKQSKTQDVRTFNHGLINEPFPKESQMFGSAKYEAGCLRYGQPKAEDLQKAMELQRKARGAHVEPVKTPEPTTPSTIPATPVVEMPAVQLKKGRKPAAAAPAKKPAAAADAAKKPAAEKKPRGRKPKVADVVVVPTTTVKAIEEIPEKVALIESPNDPLPVGEVVQVFLKPFTHGSTKYWRDGERDKVYKRMPDGRRSVYLGRWDSDLQEINRDAPDSDDD